MLDKTLGTVAMIEVTAKRLDCAKDTLQDGRERRGREEKKSRKKKTRSHMVDDQQLDPPERVERVLFECL